MDEKIFYLVPKLHKWSDLELSDLFSRLHLPLNNLGKSIGFLMIYDSIDDVCDDGENPENLIQIKINVDKTD